MLNEVMKHFGMTKEFDEATFFETKELEHTLQEIKHCIEHGRLIALTGIVGSGKTRTLRHIQESLKKEKQVLVSQSLSVEKNRLTLGVLISALFCDLRRTKNDKIPSQPEQRERDLRDLIKSKKKPVVLFVDEAHDLHGKTLVALKRLIEVIQGAGGVLSIVLAGHPKLSNDLKRASMVEIGARSTTFTLDGVEKNKMGYIRHLFKQCFEAKTKMETVIDPDATEYLVERLSTPLQIQQYLSLALTEGFRVGVKPITEDLLAAVLAYDLNSAEAQLVRQGYDIKALADALDIKSREARSFLKGDIPSGRREEIMESVKGLGINL